jgi:hypothetical protein
MRHLCGLSPRHREALGFGMTLALRNASLETSTPDGSVSGCLAPPTRAAPSFFGRQMDIRRAPAARLSVS